MKTHFRSNDDRGELLYPGKMAPDRSLFPYDYKVYDGRFDRVDDMHTDPIVDEKELNWLHDYVTTSNEFEIYNHEMIEFALQEMIEKNNGRKPRLKFLLDNSGSMRGKPIAHLIQLVYAIWKACDTLDISLEIYWNTTVAWKWGQAREDWLAEWRKRSPGRLNDIRYIIYKDANHSFEDSKRNLALMMKEWLLKENIDGEAIEWVYKRIYEENEPGNVIMHLADGAPVDDSTLSVSPANFLVKHYREATEFVYGQPDTTIYAIWLWHKNESGQFDGDTTVSQRFDEKNIVDICSLLAWVEIPDTLPREWISQSAKEVTDETTTEITHLVELFWTESTVTSHENFSLLSDELKDTIYEFFKEHANDIPWERTSAIMNFVLDGSVVDIREKMDTVLELDFLKKWIIWNEKVGDRTIKDFYEEDYKDSVKDANIITFSSCVDGYKLHWTVVFHILNALLRINNQDFASKIISHVATNYAPDDGNPHILEGIKKCSDYKMIKYYETLQGDEAKHNFVSQMLRVIDDLNEYGRFDPLTFCILHKAWINKAYVLWLKTFFNPLSVQERSEMDRITNPNSIVKMFWLDSDLLDLSPVHIWEYFKMRYKLFTVQEKVGLPFDHISFSEDEYDDAEELNEDLQDWENQSNFLKVFMVRDECIESINKLPEEIFAAFMKNKDVQTFYRPLKSWEFLLLEPYFEDPYFLTVISDTKNTLNKSVYEYLMICAKKWEFHTLDEGFFEKQGIKNYLGEKASAKSIVDWLSDSKQYTKAMIEGLTFFVNRWTFFDEDVLRVSYNDGKETFTWNEAVHALIEWMMRHYNILDDINTKEHSTDLLIYVYRLYDSVIKNKDQITSQYTGKDQESSNAMIERIETYTKKLSEYHGVFLQAEIMSLPLEKSEKDNFESQYKDMHNFLAMPQREFTTVYSWYIRKYKESTDEREQDIFQKLNVMRDLFRKLRGWKIKI